MLLVVWSGRCVFSQRLKQWPVRFRGVTKMGNNWRFGVPVGGFPENLKNLGAEELREHTEDHQRLGYEIHALRCKVDDPCSVFGESRLVLRLGCHARP